MILVKLSDVARLAKEALARPHRPTAFVVASDPLSMGVLQALREAGLTVPRDISLVSFDDIEMAAFTNPPLSTVKINAEELGRQAVKVLLNRLQGRTIPIHVIVPSRLIVRQSIQAPGPFPFSPSHQNSKEN